MQVYPRNLVAALKAPSTCPQRQVTPTSRPHPWPPSAGSGAALEIRQRISDIDKRIRVRRKWTLDCLSASQRSTVTGSLTMTIFPIVEDPMILIICLGVFLSPKYSQAALLPIPLSWGSYMGFFFCEMFLNFWFLVSFQSSREALLVLWAIEFQFRHGKGILISQWLLLWWFPCMVFILNPGADEIIENILDILWGEYIVRFNLRIVTQVFIVITALKVILALNLKS